MSDAERKPEIPPAASAVFDTPLFVGALGIMVLATGVLIFSDGQPGERVLGLVCIFAGLMAAGLGVALKMRPGPSRSVGQAQSPTRLQPLVTTAFALGVFSVLATVAMDRVLDGGAGMGERLVVLAAATFAWILPIQVLGWDRVADEAVGRGWLRACLPGYFVLMAGATAALATTFWRAEFTASVLILSLAASALVVAGVFWLDRRAGPAAP